MQVAYSGVQMWVGHEVLEAAEKLGVEQLRKSLRGGVKGVWWESGGKVVGGTEGGGRDRAR